MGLCYIAPFLIVFLVFSAYPEVYTFVVSFEHNSGYGTVAAAGWSNYIALLTYGAFWQEVENTFFYWVLHAVILIPLAFILALVVRSKFVRGKGFWRTVIFLPQVMTTVAVALVFQVAFGSPQGLLNNLFGTDVPWLTNTTLAKYVVVMLLVWQGFGFWFVIFLAGLTTLDPELEDAAVVDGASVFQKTLRVTVPLMRNILFFAVIIDAIGSMAMYTQPNVLTTMGAGQVAVPQVGTVSNILVTNLQAGDLGIERGCRRSHLCAHCACEHRSVRPFPPVWWSLFANRYEAVVGAEDRSHWTRKNGEGLLERRYRKWSTL